MRARCLDLRARLPRRASLVAICAALGTLLATPAGASAQGTPNQFVRDVGTTHGLKAELQNNDGAPVESLELTLQQSGFFFSAREGPGPDQVHLDGAVGSCVVTPVGIGLSNSIRCFFGAPNYWPALAQIVIRGFDVSSDSANPGDGNAYPDAGRGNLLNCLQPCTDPGQVRGPHTVIGPNETGFGGQPPSPPGATGSASPGSANYSLQGVQSSPATGQVFVAIQVGEAGILNATAQALLFLAGKLERRPLSASAAKGKKRKKRKVVVAQATSNPQGPGVVELALKPNKRGMRVLRRTGKLQAQLEVSFTPASGAAPTTLTSKVAFRLAKKKKKKRGK
jgi:hypothetical protein